MNYFFFFILGLVVAYGIWYFVSKSKNKDIDSRLCGNDRRGGKNNRREDRNDRRKDNNDKVGEEGIIINPEQVKKRKENLGQIMGWLASRKQITNDDVEKLLGVSNATAERYLDELEEQGKIVQVGKTGQSVFYKLK